MVKNILWDFDGVIIDSMPTREYGFRKIFEQYDDNLVNQLINYHNENGGLSRFHKIEYFYNRLLNKDITEDKIDQYVSRFTEIMKKELTNHKYLIQETVEFIKNNHQNYNFHIVSGSEHNELNYLSDELGLRDYFITINGSPTHKNILVANVIKGFDYDNNETVLIGDSINDYNAAVKNNIKFFGYNNNELKKYSEIYLNEINEILDKL